MNHTVTNRVPPPVASLPPTQPSEHELHPTVVGAEVVKDDNGGIRVHTNTGIKDVKPAADGVSDMPTKIAGGNIRPVSSERRGHVEPRSYTEYDPYPTRNPVCPVTYVTIKREDNIIDGVTPKDVAQHVGRYTGVWDIHADNKFECCRTELRPMVLSIAGAGMHVGEVERSIRTIKERVRCTTHDLPFKIYPRILVTGCVNYNLKRLNNLPADDGISSTMPPNTLVTGAQCPD